MVKSLKQLQKEAREKTRAAADKTPPPVNVTVDADPTAAILQTAQMMQQSYDAMLATLAVVQEQSAQLAKSLSQLDIKAGDVDVHIPPRAASFRIEYDDITGQPERLIPEYEAMH